MKRCNSPSKQSKWATAYFQRLAVTMGDIGTARVAPAIRGTLLIARRNETMDKKRFDELNGNDGRSLTESELAEGWHFCPDWDYLLVGPGSAEQDGCTCENNEHEMQ